ncbi:MAG: serine hydrolase domain-containing protein [Streptosporangiaceae bacterium]|jgi:CubicO group peptidase (beta-lactamase class C family)
MSTGLSDQGRKRLHEVAQRHVGDEQVPGLVALVARGDDVHAEVLGTKAVGGPAMTRDSIFRISSDSKPITAAATLALAAEGLLDLDEPVGRLLPEPAGPRVLRRMDGPLDDTVPANREITVRDLLTFTFGFRRGRDVLRRGAVARHGGGWRAAPGHPGTAGPGHPAGPGHLDRRPRQPAAAGPAG